MRKKNVLGIERNRRAPFARSRQELTNFAQQGRWNPTPCEARLKLALREALPLDIKIRSQHVLWGYIADFYIPEYHLDIEVDGSFHDHRRDYDQRRDLWLGEHGISVMRIRNEDIERRVDLVINRILRRLLQFEEEMMPDIHRCSACGVDTVAIGEYPLMLHWKVWRRITPDGAYMLCRADMEKRLGRPLTAHDRRQPWWEVDEMTVLTAEIIEAGRSANGGWSLDQLEQLGIAWPPKSGWQDKLVGKPIRVGNAAEFLRLRDQHLKPSGQIAK